MAGLSTYPGRNDQREEGRKDKSIPSAEMNDVAHVVVSELMAGGKAWKRRLLVEHDAERKGEERKLRQASLKADAGRQADQGGKVQDAEVDRGAENHCRPAGVAREDRAEHEQQDEDGNEKSHGKVAGAGVDDRRDHVGDALREGAQLEGNHLCRTGLPKTMRGADHTVRRTRACAHLRMRVAEAVQEQRVCPGCSAREPRVH